MRHSRQLSMRAYAKYSSPVYSYQLRMRRSTPLPRSHDREDVDGPMGVAPERRVSVVIHCTRDQWLRYSIDHEYRFTISSLSTTHGETDEEKIVANGGISSGRNAKETVIMQLRNILSFLSVLFFIHKTLSGEFATCMCSMNCMCMHEVCQIIEVWSAAFRVVRFLLQLQMLAYSHFQKIKKKYRRNHIKSNMLWRAIIDQPEKVHTMACI